MVWMTTFLCRHKSSGTTLALLGDAHLELPMAAPMERESSTSVLGWIQKIASARVPRNVSAGTDVSPLFVALELGDHHRRTLAGLRLPMPMALLEVAKGLLVADETKVENVALVPHIRVMVSRAPDQSGDTSASDEPIPLIVLPFDPRVVMDKAPVSSWVAHSTRPVEGTKTNVSWGDFLIVMRGAVALARRPCELLPLYLESMAAEIEMALANFPDVDESLPMDEALKKHGDAIKFSQRKQEHLKLLQYPFDIAFVHVISEAIGSRLAAPSACAAAADAPAEERVLGAEFVSYVGTNHAENIAVMLQESGEWEVTQNPEPVAPNPAFRALLPFVQPTMLAEKPSALSSSLSLSQETEEALSSPLRESHLDT